MREIKILAKLCNSSIVEYECSWLEQNENQKAEILYIQMEYCESNLKSFLVSLENSANSSLINLYIKSELFFEIVEGLNYLHSLKPLIIHRDLNPLNILVRKSSGGKNIKISDFGLSVEHEKKLFNCRSKSDCHTQERGNLAYIAPEVLEGTTYNEKCDIFSLGLVLRDMFIWNYSE
jgi:serine/threonine protein kinase